MARLTFEERGLPVDEAGHNRAELVARAEPVAGGLLVVASVFMFVAGAFHVIQGLAAIIDGGFFVATRDYAFDLQITTWGWLHVFTGAVLAAAGLLLLSGAAWTRVFAIFVAVASAIVNFFYIPYFPVWSIVTLAVDGAVIYAVATSDSDLTES